MHRLVRVSLAIVAAGQLAACGSGSQSRAEQDQRAEEYAKSFGVDVDVQTRADGSRSVTVDRSVGGMTAQAGSNLSVPAGFPDDVPVHPSINIASSGQLPGTGFMVQGQSPENIEAVASFYSTEMTSRGWAQDGDQQTPAMRMLQFKKRNRTVNLSLISNGGGTTVQIMVPPAI